MQGATTNTVENLMLDLVEWVARKERTYQETMEACAHLGFGLASRRGIRLVVGDMSLSPVRLLGLLAVLAAGGCATTKVSMNSSFENYTLDYATPVNPSLQARLEKIDDDLRQKHGIAAGQTAVGLLDLRMLRVAMIDPDREEYAASVAKVGILLAYFQAHPEAATNLDATTRHELGLMIKASSNEMASKFSHELGLKQIEQTLYAYHFYDAKQGGGIWVGKHYGQDTERIPSPVGGNSHAATVRQLLRFYLLLEQGKLVSPAASEGDAGYFARRRRFRRTTSNL